MVLREEVKGWREQRNDGMRDEWTGVQKDESKDGGGMRVKRHQQHCRASVRRARRLGAESQRGSRLTSPL